MSIVFLNGNFLDESEAMVSINDTGYYYGDGFYEVIFLHDGKLIDKELHLERAMENFRKLYFKNYPSEDEILKTIRETINVNGNKKFGIVYLQFTRGCAPRTHEFLNLNLKPNILIKVSNINGTLFKKDEISKWSCRVVEDPRRMNCDIKMISLLPMVIAKYEAEKEGFNDVIFYNSRYKTISEGSSFNVFIVNKDNVIITCPKGKQILPGCTRNRLLQIIKDNGYNFEERFFSREELYNANEVFLTASLKINAITKVDNFLINNGDVGKTTKELYSKYVDFLNSYVDE